MSKGLNHLLKSPFCVHPKTGKICIPFNANVVDKFDLDKVPTIMTLIEEINAYDVRDKAEEETYDLNKKRIKDYKKTSLNKSLHVFQEFLRHLEAERREQRLKGKRKFLDKLDKLLTFVQLQLQFRMCLFLVSADSMEF